MSAQEPKQELLPCPFCGSKAELKHHIGFSCETEVGCTGRSPEECIIRPFVQVMAETIPQPGDTLTFRPDYTRSDREATEAWNRRYPDQGGK